MLAGLGFGCLLVFASATRSSVPRSDYAADNAENGGNVQGIAALIFNRYVFAFEATSALLITAAVGAMVLAHRERLTKRSTQADLAGERMQRYAETGQHPGSAAHSGSLRAAQRGRHAGSAARRQRLGAFGLGHVESPRHRCEQPRPGQASRSHSRRHCRRASAADH